MWGDQSVLPASAVVRFRGKRCGGDPWTPIPPYYESVVALAGLGLTSTVGFSGSRSFQDSAVALFTPPATTPTNQATLDALATRIATDYYSWRTIAFDAVYNGVLNVAPNGLYDWVVIDNNPFEVATRLRTPPYDVAAEESAHFDSSILSCSATLSPVPGVVMFAPPSWQDETPTGSAAPGTTTLSIYDMELRDGRLMNLFLESAVYDCSCAGEPPPACCVIFTTCDPPCAIDLTGSIIQVYQNKILAVTTPVGDPSLGACNGLLDMPVWTTRVCLPAGAGYYTVAIAPPPTPSVLTKCLNGWNSSFQINCNQIYTYNFTMNTDYTCCNTTGCPCVPKNLYFSDGVTAGALTWNGTLTPATAGWNVCYSWKTQGMRDTSPPYGTCSYGYGDIQSAIAYNLECSNEGMSATISFCAYNNPNNPNPCALLESECVINPTGTPVATTQTITACDTIVAECITVPLVLVSFSCDPFEAVFAPGTYVSGFNQYGEQNVCTTPVPGNLVVTG